MSKRFSVGAATFALLGASLFTAPTAAGQPAARSDAAPDTADPRQLAPASAPATSLTPAMRREINRVVAAGRPTQRLSATATPSRLASTSIRCATFEEQRYCLHYGWTDRSPAELTSQLVRRENAMRTQSTVESGETTLIESLRERTTMASRARAAADRAELRQAARAVGKVVSLRHAIEGEPYPDGFLARHPEMRTVAASGSTARKRLYPKRKYIMNWRNVRQQRRSYWCGPATLQMIAWGWQKKPKPQKRWARRLGTTSSGTSIYSMVKAVNKYTGYDKKKFAGKYIVLDISNYGYRKWLRLNRRHYAAYRAPIVTHPVLDARYFGYLKGYSGSGHFQVGRGYNNRGKNPATIGLFEPWNPRRFNSSAPYVARLQYHRAYKSYQANQAHPQQNIGV